MELLRGLLAFRADAGPHFCSLGWGLGFRALGFRVEGSGFRVQGWGLGFV